MDHSELKIITVAEVDSLHWLNIRMAGIVKRTEAEALRQRAENHDMVAAQFEFQADKLLVEIQTKLSIGSEYEPTIQNNKLVFAPKS